MFADGDQVLRVVVNDEEQYSVWPLDQQIPEGWADAGYQGVKSDCLAFIETVWLDIRPLSVRHAHVDR
jgi:MbtH protein